MSESAKHYDDRFFILSIKHTRQAERSLTWWRPENAGYTRFLDWAGTYKGDDVRANREYYDNKVSTVAVPVKLALEHSHPVVHVSLLHKLAKQAEIEVGGVK